MDAVQVNDLDYLPIDAADEAELLQAGSFEAYRKGETVLRNGRRWLVVGWREEQFPSRRRHFQLVEITNV